MGDTSDRAAIFHYIQRNPLATLSTVMPDGRPYSSVLYTAITSDMSIYFVTKSDTTKCRNIEFRPAVCLAYCDEREQSTLIARGTALYTETASGLEKARTALEAVLMRSRDWLPAVAKLSGSYRYYEVHIDSAVLSKYGGVRTPHGPIKILYP